MRLMPELQNTLFMFSLIFYSISIYALKNTTNTQIQEKQSGFLRKSFQNCKNKVRGTHLIDRIPCNIYYSFEIYSVEVGVNWNNGSVISFGLVVSWILVHKQHRLVQ